MNNLKQLRKQNNLSVEQLSDQSGVNHRMIQKYENEERDINKAQAITLHRIANVLKCNIEDLMELNKKSTD